MAFDSSRLLVICSSFTLLNATENTSVYYRVTLTTCVITSLLAPMTVVANGLILAAIWKNPSLSTPSYVLLAGLSFTDFCTGLLTLPFYVLSKLGEMTGWVNLSCIAKIVVTNASGYFVSLTGIVMTIIAVERWLHMSRRSLLTVRRVVILYTTSAVLLIAFSSYHMYNWYYTKRFFTTYAFLFVFGAILCFFITGFSYFKVFRIIRHHQSQIQTNRNAVDIEKYKKSVFTILCILALFLLSYVPFVSCFLVVYLMDVFETRPSIAAFSVCGAILFFSSFANPLLYYWRIKKIRDSVRRILRKCCCKETEKES